MVFDILDGVVQMLGKDRDCGAIVMGLVGLNYGSFNQSWGIDQFGNKDICLLAIRVVMIVRA